VDSHFIVAMQYQPTISYQGKVESGDIESSFGATNDAKKNLDDKSLNNQPKTGGCGSGSEAKRDRGDEV
jgi:hypothetical protein